MQRAATGLATVCLRLLGAALRPPRRAARRHRQQRRRRAVRRGRRSPAAGARVTAVLLDPDRVARAPVSPRSAGPAGGCSPAGAPGSSRRSAGPTSSLDGMLGIGGRGGLRPDAAELARAAARGRGDHRRRRRPERRRRRHRRRRRRRLPGHAHGDLRRGQARAGRGGGPRATPAQVHLVDIGLGRTCRRRRPSGSPTPTSPPGWRRPSAGDDKYSQGVVGVVAGSATYPGAGVLCTGAALRTRPGLVRYAGTAADGVRAAWPEAIVTDGRPGGRRPRAGLGRRPRDGHRRRRARACWPRCWPPTCRSSSTPTG